MLPNLQVLESKGRMFDLIETANFKIIGELKSSGELFLHCDGVRNWSKTQYYECLTAVAAILDSAKALGLSHLWVFIPAHDRKLLKFELMMGFEIMECYRDQQGQEYVLLAQPTGV